MNFNIKFFIVILFWFPFSYACQWPQIASKESFYQDILALHTPKSDKKEDDELQQLKLKQQQRQAKFKDKVCQIREVILNVPSSPDSTRADFEHCYYRQLPIIFYVAKKDYLNGLLSYLLMRGANPQLEFKITDKSSAITPLIVAQDAKATANIATLEKAIIRAESLKMLESLQKSFYDRSTVTRYGGRWLRYDDDQPVAQWYKTKSYIELGILKSMQTLCFELVDKPFATPLVKALIDCGVTVDYRQEGRSLLGKARAGNQEETVQLLLAKGAKE